MQETQHKKTKVFLLIVLFLLIVVLLDACSLLIDQNRYIAHIDYLLDTKSKMILTVLHDRKNPANISDVALIQSWMTFDYINHLFLLPTNYIQTTLSVTDKRYPSLTIAEYAEDQHIRQSNFLVEVQEAVRLYLTTNQ